MLQTSLMKLHNKNNPQPENEEENQAEYVDPNFDINRSLIIFGEDLNGDNFMLSFDSMEKQIVNLDLPIGSKLLTSGRFEVLKLLCLHDQRQGHSNCMWRH